MKLIVKLFFGLLLIISALWIYDAECLSNFTVCNFAGWIGYSILFIMGGIGLYFILKKWIIIPYILILTLLINGYKPINEIINAFVMNSFLVIGVWLITDFFAKIMLHIKTIFFNKGQYIHKIIRKIFLLIIIIVAIIFIVIVSDYFYKRSIVDNSIESCKNNNAEACIKLGEIYSAGWYGVNENKFFALKLYEKACMENNMEGCTSAGRMYFLGFGTKENHSIALKFFDNACRKKYASGCYNLGLLYESSKSEIGNKQKAIESYGKACDLQMQDGCSNYSRLLNQ